MFETTYARHMKIHTEEYDLEQEDSRSNHEDLPTGQVLLKEEPNVNDNDTFVKENDNYQVDCLFFSFYTV